LQIVVDLRRAVCERVDVNSITDPAGNTSTYTWFANNLTQRTDANGNVTTFAWSAVDNRTQRLAVITDALGNRTLPPEKCIFEPPLGSGIRKFLTSSPIFAGENRLTFLGIHGAAGSAPA